MLLTRPHVFLVTPYQRGGGFSVFLDNENPNAL